MSRVIDTCDFSSWKTISSHFYVLPRTNYLRAINRPCTNKIFADLLDQRSTSLIGSYLKCFWMRYSCALFGSKLFSGKVSPCHTLHTRIFLSCRNRRCVTTVIDTFASVDTALLQLSRCMRCYRRSCCVFAFYLFQQNSLEIKVNAFLTNVTRNTSKSYFPILKTSSLISSINPLRWNFRKIFHLATIENLRVYAETYKFYSSY